MGKSRTIVSLASILSFRMLGLFMIYPVFTVYAPQFNQGSSFLIGIALGIYGLTQALLQFPLSTLSDRWGRKPIITFGLLILALGSIISALTHNIYILILGRALQGSGAIGSTLMAYAADVTSVENRTKAMALMGITIGISFALSMVLGPLINSWVHLSGIFWLTALFALFGILIQYVFLPPTSLPTQSKQPLSRIIKSLFKQDDFLFFNISILVLHAILTASFVAIPLFFSQWGITSNAQWKIYLPVLFAGFAITLPILIIAEKKHLIKHSLVLGVLALAVAEFLFFGFPTIKNVMIMALFCFFFGFTLLEALLPSLVSKIAPPLHRGSAMGIFSTFQFMGIFIGGVFAGLIRSHYNDAFIFYYCSVLCGLWLCFLGFSKVRYCVLQNES
ncbi:MAG: MFS transporter [Gammaproteobacteria bacterium]|nr:MFS transporter [Gammaproteobacteria bacterium]